MSKRILIIEDDEEFVEVLGLILGSSGYETLSCSTADEGLRKAKEEKPDLIILDVMLVGGISDGFRVAQTLKQSGPESEYSECSKIPILMVSAVSDAMEMDFAELAGTEKLPVEAFMEKPVEPVELLAAVRRLLD